MHFPKSTIALLAVFASFVAAQETPASSESAEASATSSAAEVATDGAATEDATGTATAETPEGSVMVHVIRVGNENGDLVFDPPSLSAKTGEMVQFHFYPSNHSVAQGTFDQGCAPSEDENALYSGFMAVKAEDTEMPIWTIPIEDDTKPIWLYCPQGDHCQKGMVGVINQPEGDEEKTLEKYAETCAGASENVIPGGAPAGGESSTTPEEEGGSSEGGSSTLATSATSAPSSEATSSNSTVAAANAASGLNIPATSSVAIFLAAVASAMLI